MKFELVKQYFAEVAHQKPTSSGPSSRLHGHSLKIEIVLEGPIDPAYGWVVDFKEITRYFNPLYKQLDHHCLNEIDGLDDTSPDGVARWIYERMYTQLKELKEVRVSIVGGSEFVLTELPDEPHSRLPRRWRFSIEAAQRLEQLPPDHSCNKLHGHTYRIEIGARDMDRLKPLLQPLYDVLDHRYLNEISWLNEATSERLCEWIWDQLSAQVDDLLVVVVQETENSRCIYYGE